MENIPLTPAEDIEYREGLALQEMQQTAGFQVLKQWLEDRAFHTWADPRDTQNEAEWKWKELNAFWAAKTAEELLLNIAQSVSRADYLGKVKSGEIQRHRMEIK